MFYVPEYETVAETREKISERRRVIAGRIKKLGEEYLDFFFSQHCPEAMMAIAFTHCPPVRRCRQQLWKFLKLIANSYRSEILQACLR